MKASPALLAIALSAAASTARADNTAEALRLVDRGVVLYRQGELESARALFEAAEQLVPNKPNPHRWLGLVDAKVARCAEAVRELDAFLELVSPNDARAPEAVAVRDKCRATLAPPPVAPAVPINPWPTPPPIVPPARAVAPPPIVPPARAVAPPPIVPPARAVALPLDPADRVLVCADGRRFWFCDGRGGLTENEFIRRWRARTGSVELDSYAGVRTKSMLVVSAVLIAAGVGVLAIGAAQLQDDSPACQLSDCNLTPEILLGAGAGTAGIGLTLLIVGLVNRDGSRYEHRLAEEESRNLADRYNAFAAPRASVAGPSFRF